MFAIVPRNYETAVYSVVCTFLLCAREIGAQDLIDKFVGDNTGAPLRDAAFTLETDDG